VILCDQQMASSSSSADLSLTKTDGVASVNTGATLTYTLTVANAGPDASGTGVTVSDTLPTNVTVNAGAAGALALTGANAADWSCSSDAATPQGISCTTTVSIASAGTSVFSFSTDALPAAAAGTTLTNTATVIADPAVTDPAGANNTGTDTDTVVNPVGGNCPVADQFFGDGFESGDLSAWDGSTTGTGDSIGASTVQANTGTYSVRAEVDSTATGRAFVFKDFAGQTTISAKVYIYLDPAFSISNNAEVVYFTDGVASQILNTHIKSDMTLNLWNQVVGENYATTTTISTGVWHTLEMQAVINGASSEARLWFDGNLEIEQTGIDLGTNPITRFNTGYFWANPADEPNIVYVDDVTLCTPPASSTISGTLYEDVNYGGGVGRDLATANADSGAFTIERDGVVVELYDAGGNYISNTTTAGGGLYSFSGLTPALYTVRVVNDTVTSTRVGSTGAELGVQTYRIDGDGEPVGTGANKVGGEQPADFDAPANGGSDTLAALQAPANQFTQSIVTVDASGGNVNNVDFGFNFDTIVNTDDANQGSLRQFLLNANLLTDNAALAQNGLTAGVENSIFMIPGAGDALGRPQDPGYNAAPLSYTIQPTAVLPTITDPVVLDGTTQPDFPGTPIVVVDGNDLAADGLTLTSTADGSTIRGLVIRDFAGDGIQINTGSDNNVIAGNYIGRLTTAGTDAGAGEENTGEGINLLGDNTTIGGTAPSERNVISGNGADGILIDASNVTIQGNFIGLDGSGVNALANTDDGIDIDGGTNLLIGGSAGGAGNVVSASGDDGIDLNNGALTDVVIQGNFIGTDVTGTLDRGNLDGGIVIESASTVLIGGTAPSEGNVIAYSKGPSSGVHQRSDTAHIGRTIFGNSIHSNNQLGINLDRNNVLGTSDAFGVTANDDPDVDGVQNFPDLASATTSGATVTVTGTLIASVGESYRIEFFANAAADASGYGEGERYLGFANVVDGGAGDTDGLANGTIAFSAVLTPAGPVVAGEFITATATRADGTFTSFFDTSEFAQNVVAVSPSSTISGTLYEDVNYGGGVGRDLTTANADSGAFTIERDGVTVELYDAAGNYISNTTTAGGGLYSFSGLTPALYTVRVVNDTVTSTRVGSTGAELGVQTYRIDGDGEPVGTGANKVGGEQPADFDAPANGGSDTLAALQAPVGQFTQSIVTVDASAGDVNNVDFGFNFDTIVNTDDANQGSLRQFLLNANLLTDNAALAQNGLTAGVENSIFMIPSATDPLGRSVDPNFAGGVAVITPATVLPTITDADTNLDASTQTLLIGDTNAGGPEVRIDGVSLPAGSDGLTVTTSGGLISGLDIRNFATVGGAAIVLNGASNISITNNYMTNNGDVATGLDSAVSLTNASGNTITGNTATANGRDGIRTNPTSDNNTVSNNVLTNNGDDGLTFDGGTGNVAENNTVTGNLGTGIELYDNTSPIVRGNTVSSNGGGTTTTKDLGILCFTCTNALIENNTVNNNVSHGIVVGQPTSTAQITQNSVFGNGGLGIDLGDDGVTANDPLDADTGPNDLLNFPDLTAATVVGPNVTVDFDLDVPAGWYRIEFFTNTAADPSNFGEGETFADSVNINHTGSGVESFSHPFAGSIGDIITATATFCTDGAACSTFGNTSEFSQFETAVAGAASLLGRYCFNEDFAGQGPTEVLDDQASPIPLAIAYDAPVNWTLVGGNRGLEAASEPHAGFVSADVTGTKYTTNLDGDTQASFVTVAEWTPATDTQRIAGFQSSSGSRVAMFGTRSSGELEIRIRTNLQTPMVVTWGGLAWADGTRRVFHVVYDSNDPTDNRRIRLYMNGVDQGVGTLQGTSSWPAPGEALDLSGGVVLGMMNVAGGPPFDKPLNGTVFHYAVYDGELTDGEISTDATALLADDDCGISTFDISGTVYHDVDADADIVEGGTLTFAGATVGLYRDSGNAVIDGGEILVATTTTDGSGNYSFSGLSNGTYYVLVDSTTLAAAGYNGSFTIDDVWAGQTYGVSGAAVGAGFTPTAGTLYGGRNAGISDDAAALTSAEHVIRRTLSGADATSVNFGFSFNVVTNTRGGDATDDDGAGTPRTIQGALRQFIQNANAIAGANAMRFVPVPATNATDGGGNNWWQLSVTNALPQLGDANTTIDGQAYSPTDGVTVLNTNSALLGFVGAVGLGADATPGTGDEPTLTGVQGPELEIVNNRAVTVVPRGLDLQANDLTVRRIGIYGFGTAALSADANIRIGVDGGGTNFTGTSIEDSVIGSSSASFTDPGAADRSAVNDVGVFGADGGTIRNNLIGYAGRFGIFLSDTAVGWTVQSNEIRGNALTNPAQDGMDIGNGSSGTTVTANLFVLNDGGGLDSWRGLGGNLVDNNTFLQNGQAGTEPAGFRVFGNGNTIRLNNFDANVGPGILVVSDIAQQGSPSIQNLISQNRFSGNGSNAIDLLALGGNASLGDGITLNDGVTNVQWGNIGIDYPVITSAIKAGANTTVSGTAATGATSVEIYRAVAGAGDTSGPSNYGEGVQYLGTAAVVAGNWSIIVTGLNAGDDVSAIALDGSSNTSEFSANFTVVAATLAGHWPFDEGVGQTAGDVSGNGNDGTLGATAAVASDDPSWTCVAGGNALDFDGSDDEVLLSNVTIGDRAAFTISAWIRMGPDSADQRTIYSEGNTATTEYLFLYVDDATSNVRFYSEDPGPPFNFAQLQGTSNVEDNTWHHVTIVQRSKTDRELYVDGLSENTDTNNAGTYTFDTASIGFLRTDWVADPFLGLIDDVRIYDYALSPAEISALAASPPGPCGTSTISGTIYEDVNYGGGVGRDLATANADSGAFTIERDGVTVELYDAAGNFISNTTTAGGGLYSFSGLTPANYTVRVVNSTVTSTRVGSNGSELSVQTYRIDGDGEPVGTGANKVGGEQPADFDAPANGGADTLATLQAPANQFTQSIVTVDASGGNVNNVDFGFNFDTIVNSDDANQGSLRQFLLNANLLTDNAALAQNGRTAAVENSIFMIPGAGDALGRPADPGYSGAPLSYTIAPTAVLPTITDPVVLDGTTQPDFPGTPIIELNGTGAGAGQNGLTITASNSTVRGLVINRFGGHGIRVSGGANNVIAGNYIGTNVLGSAPQGNGFMGVELGLGSTNNRIGGTAIADRNVISGNSQNGVSLIGGSNINSIEGNYIGLNAAGTGNMPNGLSGVAIDGANTVTIGGAVAGAGNVISGNAQQGIWMNNSTGSIIQGNFIGTNANGDGPVANGGFGIVLEAGATNIQIGGNSAAAKNVVSANTQDGIFLNGAGSNTIQGNFIGTDATGLLSGFGNGGRGIHVLSASANTIGGTGANRNVISGNTAEGIIIRSGSSGTIVRGNYIGVAANGTSALGNGQEGIQIDTGSPGTIIGGSAVGAGNVIGTNGITSGAAISIGDDNSDNTVVQGNFIGTDATGTVNLGNIRSGVEVRGTGAAATSPLNTLIGGTNAGEGNVIRFNALDGVRVRNDAVDVHILGNAIDQNGQLGINLWPGGVNDSVTANDAGDVDTGSNDLLNFPELNSATVVGANVTISFDLDVPAGSYRIEFFRNTAADPSNFGEGETFASFVNITHPGGGSQAFNHTFPGSVGDILTATATFCTDGATCAAFGNTSEFSQFETAVAAAANLLAQYWVDEAATGQAPATLNDNAVGPLNLPITYPSGTTPLWADGANGNRHLRFFDPVIGNDTGGARVNVGGTKMDALHGSMQATMEVKYMMDGGSCAGEDGRIFGIADGGGSGFGQLEIRQVTDNDTLAVKWAGQASVARYALGAVGSGCPITTPSTVHWVIDTTEPVAADRVRAYINGVQTAVSVQTGALPGLNETIDLGVPANREMFLGLPHSGSGIRTLQGRIWYAALYSGVLSDPTISANATAINACDDLNAPCSSSISGNVFEDVNGDANPADAVGISAATVSVYRDDGDGIPNAADTFVSSTPTDGSGNYSFPILTPATATYWVAVDSKTLSANTNVWAEQTYGVAGARCDDGTGTTTELGAVGACYGGQLAAVSDNAAALATTEHVIRVATAPSNVTGVDFGFSFNVVTNTRGGDATDDDGGAPRTIQGSLRQFIQNANAIAGANAMRFVPAVATNATGGGGNWWRISVTNALPVISGANTTLDGTAYSRTDGVTVRNDNPNVLGAGGTVGVDALALSQVQGPELEIVGVNSLMKGLEVQANDVTIRRFAIYGFGDGVSLFTPQGNIFLDQLTVTNTLIEANVLGSGASSFTDPGAGVRTGGANIWVEQPDNGTVRNNLIGFGGFFGVFLFNSANTWTIENNELRGNGLINLGTDGIDINAGSINATVRGNLFAANNGSGVDMFNGGGTNLIENNTITANGTGGSEDSGIRVYGDNNTIRRNIITTSAGSGIMIVNDPGSSPPHLSNRISQNAIFNNGKLAIDLHTGAENPGLGTSPFVTANDAGDADGGANLGQNFPVITSAVWNGVNTVVQGTLNSTASATFDIEVFSNAVCNGDTAGNPTAAPGDFGEGEVYRITDTQPTDVGGNASFTVNIPVNLIGQFMTASATNTVTNDTSEFSQCAPVLGSADLALTKTDAVVAVNVGGTLTYTLTVANAGPNAAGTGVTPGPPARSRSPGPMPRTGAASPMPRARRASAVPPRCRSPVPPTASSASPPMPFRPRSPA
jgi:uncharacterized repeat protein (TIGR01451 family)